MTPFGFQVRCIRPLCHPTGWSKLLVLEDLVNHLLFDENGRTATLFQLVLKVLFFKTLQNISVTKLAISFNFDFAAFGL